MSRGTTNSIFSKSTSIPIKSILGAIFLLLLLSNCNDEKQKEDPIPPPEPISDFLKANQKIYDRFLENFYQVRGSVLIHRNTALSHLENQVPEVLNFMDSSFYLVPNPERNAFHLTLDFLLTGEPVHADLLSNDNYPIQKMLSWIDYYHSEAPEQESPNLIHEKTRILWNEISHAKYAVVLEERLEEGPEISDMDQSKPLENELGWTKEFRSGIFLGRIYLFELEKLQLLNVWEMIAQNQEEIQAVGVIGKSNMEQNEKIAVQADLIIQKRKAFIQRLRDAGIEIIGLD